MKPRIRFLPLLIITCLMVPPGCRDSEENQTEQPAAKPFAGQNVVIAVPAGYGFAQSWELILQEWEEQTGAEHEYREYSLENGKASLSAQLGFGKASADSKPPTLFLFPTTGFSELVEEKLIAEVPRDEQAPERLDWLDLFSGLRENVVSSGRKKFGALPLSSPVLVCYYRKDLLEKANLAPPQTWREYQTLLETLDQWAPGLTAVEPWGETFRSTMFFSRAAAYAKHPENYSFYFDITNGTPLINTPGFVRALDETKRALAKMPAEIKNYSPADCRREFLSGKAALAITYESQVAHERPQGMQVGIMPLPGVRDPYNRSVNRWQPPADGSINKVGVTGFAGLSAAVSANSSSQQSQAAWNLLKRLAVDEFSSVFPPRAKTFCRETQFEAATTWLEGTLTPPEAFGYLNAVAESLRNNQLICALPVLGRRRFQSALSLGLNEALNNSVESQKALDAVAQKWREIAGELGTSEVTNSYRRRLGLTSR